MTADPDDLSARMIEAAARAASKPLANMRGGCFLPAGRDQRADCADGDCYCVRVSRHCARAALAAAVREAGLDAEALRLLVSVIDNAVEFRRVYEAGTKCPPLETAHTDRMERAARMLRALAGIADAE